MNWLYGLSALDYGLIFVFIALYALYVVRVVRIARQAGTRALGIVPKWFLRSTYFTLLMLAILGPLFGDAGNETQTAGHDIFLVVDVSRSMDAADVTPSRLERVKFDIQQLADTLPNSRFGIILSAAEASVMLPLTSDHAALKQLVQAIRTDEPAYGGTNLCAALGVAQQKFLLDSSGRHSARSVVVFSDGEDFGTCPPDVRLSFRKAGLTLSCVGVGTEIGAPIREPGGYIKDAAGQVVTTKLNRPYLQQLAKEGQGIYVEVRNAAPNLNELAAWLRSRPGSSVGQTGISLSTNKYSYFVWGALLLLSLDMLFTLRTFRL